MEYEALALPALHSRVENITLPTGPLNLIKKDNKKLSYMYCLRKQPDGKGL